jgi:hypothetical protein
MEYSQQQVRRAIGISTETIRYWKRALSPLADKSGKTVAFSAGEILALTIVNILVRSYRMDISVIAPIANPLFEVCRQPLRFGRHPTFLWIDLDAPSLALVTELQRVPTDRHCLVVPVSCLWQQISENLTATDRSGEQQELLPLASVR